PIKILKHLSPVLLVEMDEHFGIRLGVEPVSAVEQVLAKLGIVKYFTVKDEPQVFVLIVNRLIASAEIDDAQPRVSQAGVLVPVYTEGVRSTMADASQHAAKEIFRRLRAAIGEIDNSCNPTHFDTSRYGPA